MSRKITLALSVLVVLVLGACSAQEPEISLEDQVPADQRQAEPTEGGGDGGDAGGEASGDAVVIEAFDLGFEGPDELPAGAVTLRLDNTGNLPHDITIEELGDQVVAQADGGSSDEATVELEPGTYTLYCSVPGHRSSMEKTVEVTG